MDYRGVPAQDGRLRRLSSQWRTWGGSGDQQPAQSDTAFSVDELTEIEPAPFQTVDAEEQPQTLADEIDLTTERFVDQFVHEYFTALGLAHLSPYPYVAEWQEEWQDDDSLPFMTYDDDADILPEEVAEAETDAPLD